jgi:hypothetical protein
MLAHQSQPVGIYPTYITKDNICTKFNIGQVEHKCHAYNQEGLRNELNNKGLLKPCVYVPYLQDKSRHGQGKVVGAHVVHSSFVGKGSQSQQGPQGAQLEVKIPQLSISQELKSRVGQILQEKKVPEKPLSLATDTHAMTETIRNIVKNLNISKDKASDNTIKDVTNGLIERFGSQLKDSKLPQTEDDKILAHIIANCKNGGIWDDEIPGVNFFFILEFLYNKDITVDLKDSSLIYTLREISLTCIQGITHRLVQLYVAHTTEDVKKSSNK